MTKEELEYRLSIAETLYKIGLYQKAVYEVTDLIPFMDTNRRVARLVKALEKKGVLCKRQERDSEMIRALRRYSRRGVKREKRGKVRIHGKLRLAGAVDSKGDILWKYVNPDKDSVPYEKSWRYLWGEERENTFDPKVYSRLELNISTEFDSTPNLFVQLVLDPWSYVGTVDAHIESTTGNDQADVRLKYLFATGRTLNETFRTDLGNILNFDEIKVVDGKLSPYTPTGLYDWWTYFNPIGGEKLHKRWNILRKLWIDYNREDWLMKLFVLSDQSEALTSDDPLRLSNNHRDWEESPWIDTYEPSRIFARTGYPVKAGKWVRNISAYVRDSDWNRLTFLRGASLGVDLGDVVGKTVVALPLTLWDDYDDINSAQAATRWKFFLDRERGDYIGFLGTVKLGFNSGEDLEAENYVVALDGASTIGPVGLEAELAYSTTRIDEANGYESEFDGYAYKLELSNRKKLGSIFHAGIYGAYMDDGFFPGLSNYRYTRRGEERTKHIYFDGNEEPAKNDDYLVYGDGMERGRIAIGGYLKGKLRGFYTDLFARNVHSDSGGHVESLVRAEITGQILPKLTLKALAWYKFFPKTKEGQDPLISADNIYALSDYYSGQTEMMENADIEGGKDPSIGHFSIGLKYNILSNLSLQGIVEYTNDLGDFPRLLFSDTYVTDVIKDGVVWDKMVPFLYDQDIFGLPPYPYYHIVRLKLNYSPWEWLALNLSYTRNENKFATGIDDNVNHIGIEMEYKVLPKMRLTFAYVYSQLYDLYKYNQEDRLDYVSHNNFFVGINWYLSDEDELEIMWGEYGPYSDEKSYWYLSALDTQHFFRIVYKRKF